MSAAPECLSAAIGDFSQFQMAQYSRHFKEEVLDPAYSAGGVIQNSSAPPVSSNGLAASAFSGAPVAPPVSNQPAQKTKRSYTRKPSTGTKAKKIKTEPTVNTGSNAAGQSQIGDHMPVQKKKRDRFKGTTEEEVLTRVLPDHVREDLDILIVGINPGLTAAYVQHHYAGPGNHFWKCLYLSGMIPEPMNALQDAELLNYGIGFTNIVARTTRGSADLTRKEIYEGGQILKQKMLKFLPKIALFNGKGIYEVFCGHKNFNFGLQPDPFPDCPDTCVFVNPSSSARCTQLPRAVDKVPFYEALKRVRDHIRVHGSIQGIDRTTVTFPDFKLVTAPQKVKKEVKAEPKDGEEGVDSSAQVDSAQKPSAPAATKATKAKKPRVRAKKEKPVVTPTVTSAPQTTSAPPVTNHLTTAQQSYLHAAPLQQQCQPGLFPDSAMQSMHLAQVNGDFSIKQEVVDAEQQDKDLAAIIQQSINVQQSMYQQHQQQQQQHHLQQHQSVATPPGTHSHPINVPNTAAVMMPSQAPSAVKQERPDWNGYGVMPSYASNAAPTSMNAYPAYSCYWNPYLPTTSSMMTNGYSTIPAPQIAHQQAVAAAAALHTSVAASQANMVSATPAIASYNSPQEASSPAMSSQSNLTQASLDSLPKADSASTVANWLQSIPHS